MTKTTIQLEQTTKQGLNKLGRRGESYDDIINRLIFKKERTKTKEVAQ